VKRLHILRKRWVGREVCCCDLQHRTIKDVDLTGMAYMTDGSHYDIYHCTSPIEVDGTCHSVYLTSEE
jgi:hypothetical protein